MKYSINYYKGCRYLNKTDEIMIDYSEKDTALLKFVKKYDAPRIVVNCTQISEEDLLGSIDLFKVASKMKAFAVLLRFEQKKYLPDLAENNIKYFFTEHVNTIDKLNSLIQLGVSDVYITDELGFCLKDVGIICHENKVNVRVYPNIAQSTGKVDGDTFKYFYIRPEDVSIYEPYVDYFEFFGKLDRQAVLYKIYKEGQWLGSLNELIGGLKDEIPNVCIVPYFGTARVGCGKRCSYNKSCEVCSNIKNLAKVLESKDFGITTERKKIDEGMKIKYDK